jgi:hypothetical protein
LAATVGSASLVLRRVLGTGGSSSRMHRSSSSNAVLLIRRFSSGVEPVNSSYSSTPNE